MADYIIKDSELTGIANAIRTKGGTSSPLVFPNGFTSAIEAIPTGGGSTLITKNITQNGTYDAEDDDADGYSSVIVNVSGEGGGTTGPIIIDSNGTYIAQQSGFDGYDSVTVNMLSGIGKTFIRPFIPINGIGNINDLWLYIDYSYSDNNFVPYSSAGTPFAGQRTKDAYLAFDGNLSTEWHTSDWNFSNLYVGKQFDSAVIANSVKLIPRVWGGHAQCYDFYVEASNDGENWVSFGLFPMASYNQSVWTMAVFENSTPYLYYRIRSTLDQDGRVNGSATMNIYELQIGHDVDGPVAVSYIVKNVYRKVGSNNWVSILQTS